MRDRKVSFCMKNGGFLNTSLHVLEGVLISRKDEIKSKAIFERRVTPLHDERDILTIIWKFYGENDKIFKN